MDIDDDDFTENTISTSERASSVYWRQSNRLQVNNASELRASECYANNVSGRRHSFIFWDENDV